MRLYIFIFAIFSLGCGGRSTVDRSTLIDEAVLEAESEYRSTLLKKCRSDNLERAQVYVDSIVAVELAINDTISTPARPERPVLGKIIQVNDSVKARPILEEY